MMLWVSIVHVGIVVLVSYSSFIEALYCLSCTDSISPRHCHTVRKCDDGQVCYTKSHLTVNRIVVYDTGCTYAQTCQSKHEHMASVSNIHGADPSNHSSCVECCSTDLCNNRGCEQPGYPVTRGPICFNCLQVSDPRLCDKIKACQRNEVCHIRKEMEFGDTYYVSGCSDTQACSSYLDIFGKRSLDSCSRCCHGDLCNGNCGNVTSPTITTSTMSTMTTSPTSFFQTTSTTQKPMSRGSRGREFLVLFMKNSERVAGSLTIYLTTTNTSTVRIESSPHLDLNIKSAIDKNVSITSDSNFTLPYQLTCEDSKIEPKGVLIQTSELSTVTIFDSYDISSNDGTLVIPTNKLATQYLISSTHPQYTNEKFNSQFAIGCVMYATEITIHFKIANNSTINLLDRSYRDGDVFSTTLDRFETFQVGHNTDLSGTFITSTKPMAVFSGNRCDYYIDYRDCSHTMTQIPPTIDLDYQFIVPPFFHNQNTLLQVVTQTQNTVNLTFDGRRLYWNLNEREFRNMKSNHTIVLVSRQPILVTGIGMGDPSDVSSPYMTAIPGVHQYLDYYKITVPAGYTENFLCIMIPAVSIDYLQINGLSIYRYHAVYRRSVHLDETYIVRVLQVPNTDETFVLSTSEKSKFGLIVYGHRRKWDVFGHLHTDGYGFAGNFVLP